MSCPKGYRRELPCPACDCEMGTCDKFAPEPVCGTALSVPCLGCVSDCAYFNRREWIFWADRHGSWWDDLPSSVDWDPSPGEVAASAATPVPVGDGLDVGVLAGLNDNQREVATHRDGPALVIAGAGSGKTKSLTARIASLIESGVDPRLILGITFTRKAADEIRGRVAGVVGSASKHVDLSTFHSLCLNLCRENPSVVGRRVGLSVWDEGTTRKAMRDIVKDLIDSSGLPSEPRTYNAVGLLELLDQWKESGAVLGPDFSARLEQEHPAWGREALCAVSLFEASKKEANAMDFADLVWSIVCAADRDESFSMALGSRWRYVMVDEYQDTNSLQERLVYHLAKSHRNLMVVGDDDQSIYAFRGSEVRHILTFPDRWNGARVIYLGQNYRSTPEIVATAAASISVNSNRMEKRLWSERPSGGPVSLVSCTDQFREAAAVSESILRSVSAGAPVGEHAILVRTRRQMHHFIKALSAVSLPTRAIGVASWWEREDARLLFSWLRLISNPRDIPSAAYVLARWPGIGATTVARWKEMCGMRGGAALGPPLRAMTTLKGYGRNTKRGGAILHLVQAHEVLVDAVERGASVSEVLEWMYGVSGIDADILEGLASKEPEESEIRSAHKAVAIDSAGKVSGRGVDGLTEFMDLVLVSSNQSYNGFGVWISTIHAAKGLEFGSVWVCGCTDGIFPSVSDPSELEEERRLFYVAMTRAKHSLELCCPIRIVLSDGTWTTSRVSKFVREAEASGFVVERQDG